MRMQQSLHAQLNPQLCLSVPHMVKFAEVLAIKPLDSMLVELAKKIYDCLSEQTKEHKSQMSAYWILGQLKRHFRDAHVYDKTSGSFTAAGKGLLQVLTNIHAILHKASQDNSEKSHAVEQVTLIAEKLCEELGECTKGFHNRANIVWSSLFVPKNFAERLYLIRHQIVQQVADTLAAEFCSMHKSAEAHVHNQITRIAHERGCGTLIENPYDSNVILSAQDISLTHRRLIEAFQEKYTPLLIIQQLENQLRDQLLALGYENRRIEQGYDNDIYNQWPDFINTVFPKKEADDRDFLYWFITDNGVDTDENEDDYRAPLVFDINWRKIREAIYQTLLHEGFIVNCRYKKLGDFPYNPDSHQEYQYWLCNIALPTDLIPHLAQNKIKYHTNLALYRNFLINTATSLTKEHAFYTYAVTELLTNIGPSLRDFLLGIPSTELFADVIAKLNESQWDQINLRTLLSSFFAQKNSILLHHFLLNAPANIQEQMRDDLTNPAGFFSRMLPDYFKRSGTEHSLYAHLGCIVHFCKKNHIEYPAKQWLIYMKLDSVTEQKIVAQLLATSDYTDAKNFLQLIALLCEKTQKKLPWNFIITEVLKEKSSLMRVLLDVIAFTYEPSIQYQLFSSVQPNLIYVALKYAPDTLPDILRSLEKLGQRALIQHLITQPSTTLGYDNVLHGFFISDIGVKPQSFDKLLEIITRYLSEAAQQALCISAFSWQDFLSKNPTLEQIHKVLEWQKTLRIPLEIEDSRWIRTFFMLDFQLLPAELKENTNADFGKKYLQVQLALNTCQDYTLIIEYLPLLAEFFPAQLVDLLIASGINKKQLLIILNSPFSIAEKAYGNVLDYILLSQPYLLLPFIETVSTVTNHVAFLLEQNFQLHRVVSSENLMQILQIFKEKEQAYTLTSDDKKYLADCLSKDEIDFLIKERLIPVAVEEQSSGQNIFSDELPLLFSEQTPQAVSWIVQNIQINQFEESEDIIRFFRMLKEKNQFYRLTKENKLHLNRHLSAKDWFTISMEGLIPAALIKEKKEIILQYIDEIEDVSIRQNIIKKALDAQTNLGAFFGTQRGFFKCRKTAGTWKKLGQMLAEDEIAAPSVSTSLF